MGQIENRRGLEKEEDEDIKYRKEEEEKVCEGEIRRLWKGKGQYGWLKW